MNLNKLRGKIAEKGKTTKEYAKFLNISVQALNKKLNGKTKFTTDDAYISCEFLGITDPTEKADIFLT